MKSRIVLAFLLALASPASVSAQTAWPSPSGAGAASGSVAMCLNGSSQAVPCSVGVPLQIAGSFSATLGGFTPALTFANLTATATSASVALPAGAVVIFQNTGTTAVSCTLGVGSATAVANEIIVQPGSSVALTVGSNTFGACIDQSGSVSNVVALTGGAGLPTGWGGGGSGGGGGGAVTMASGAVASGAYASGAFASGSFASGSHASGSFASGAFASGSVASGAMVDLGAQADAACGTATGTCSLIALQKFNNTSTSAGTAAIGAAPPSSSIAVGNVGSGATGGLLVPQISCDNKAIYDASTSGSTELVALTASRTIYVCGYSIMASGTVNVKLIYGTGTACATGSTNMLPAWQLTAQVGIVDPSPFYRGLKTASANALCINTSGAVSAQAIVYYAVL